MINQCPVCGSDQVTSQWITNKTGFYGLTLEFFQCSACDFVACPSNQHHFVTQGDFEQSERIGDGTHLGREYYMLQDALESIEQPKVDVLFFGSGLSKDFEPAAKLERVASVATTDTRNFVKSDCFVPLNSERQFDIVICSEVIEHFENPKEDFQTLFKFVKPSGLIICSTNINDLQEPLANQGYAFIAGHVSCYSGRSLLHLAKENGFNCDFRFPEIGLKSAGPRKRYIYFFKDPKIQEGISLHFSRTPFAYSETFS